MTRLRLLVALCRPSLLLLLGLSALLGIAQAGGIEDPAQAARPMVVVLGFLVASVILNDLVDTAVDTVNVPDRPLVTGMGSRRELSVIAVGAAAVAVIVAATIAAAALVVVAVGLVLSAAYSLQLSRRGVLASLVLPALFVAVPFLVGLSEVRSGVERDDLLLLAGLYLGFMGRIVLKDFRDVAGDTLYGKRTFLVRHGRAATCAFSAVGWTLGPLCLLGVRQLSAALVVVELAFVGAALLLLRSLAADHGHRHDERAISALAIVGRGVVLCVVAHLGMVDAEWPVWASSAMTVALGGLTLGQAWTMLRHGPAPTSAVVVPDRSTEARW